MRIISLLVFSVLFIFSCTQKDEVTSNESNINTISGRIENWDLGAGKVLKLCQETPFAFYKLDSSIISENGEFYISLNTTPKLCLINWGNSLNINNKNTMISDGFMKLQIFSNNKSIGYVYLGKFTNFKIAKYTGDFFIGYYYVDNDVIIAGSQNRKNVNLDFSHGWNKFVYKYTLGFPYYSDFPDEYSTELTTDFSERNQNGAKWLYYLE